MIKRKWFVIGVILILLLVGAFKMVNLARRAKIISDDRISWIKSTLIAHRGMYNNNENVLENTIPAFAKAIENEYIIELDVSMTKDKKLVVFHDKKLKRIFGVNSYLVDMTYAELDKLNFPNSDEKIPLFSDVLTFVDGKVPLLIEIKNEGEVGEMESMIYDELKGYTGQYAIQSFNPYTVSWFKKNAPNVLRGQLSGNFVVSDYEVEYAGTTRLPWYKRFILSNLLLNFESRPNFIAYEINNTDIETFESLKKLGVPILGWTIRENVEYEKIKDVCDGFITEIFNLK